MVSIDNLANEIARQLEQFTELVEEEVEQAKEDITKNIVAELKQTSPELTGKYRKGWRRKKVGNSIVVHNRTYQLTHLLEHGHVNRDGSRTPGKAHIRPAEERAVNDYLERVERAIQG